MLPITIAYLAGFNDKQHPLKRSISFCSGIVIALIILGSLSGLLGKIYGQLPGVFSIIIAFITVIMGLTLLGVINLSFPSGPNPEKWRQSVPAPIAPISAGLAFGLASSPCTTPVLAVLIAWIAKTGDPIIGITFLAFFGMGQIVPLFIAGSFAATIPKLLELKKLSRWIPRLSGMFFLIFGLLSLLSKWI